MSSIKEIVLSNDIVLISKNNCIFCTKLKDLLKEIGVDMSNVLVLNIQDDPKAFADLADEVMDITSCSTFPQLFVGRKFVGGYKDMFDMHQFNFEGIQKMFRDVGVTIESDF